MFISERRKPYFVMSSVIHEVYQALKDTMDDEPILYNGVIKIHAHGFLIETDIVDHRRLVDKEPVDDSLLTSGIVYIDNHAFHAMKRWATEMIGMEDVNEIFSGSASRQGVMALSRITKPGSTSMATGREVIEYRKMTFEDGTTNITATLWNRNRKNSGSMKSQLTAGQELMLSTLNDCHLYVKDRIDREMAIEAPEYDTFESHEINEQIREGFTAEQIFNFDHAGAGLPCVVSEAVKLAVSRMADQILEEAASPR